MARIWIVEDDPTIGLLIEMTVKKDGHEAVRFNDAEELEAGMKKTGLLPDLMLLDLMLHKKNGFEVLKDWKSDRRTMNIPVMIISARSAEQDKVSGLDLGAEDYITKPFGVRELQARIKTALRRTAPTVSEHMDAGPVHINADTREVTVNGKPAELTSMEFDLLLYLARHTDHVVTRDMLLRDVWGYAGGDDMTRTVDSHIKTLRLKLGDDARDPKYIKTVRGSGYRLIAGDNG